MASYAPDLVDFAHLCGLPYGERCAIQQFLATKPEQSEDDLDKKGSSVRIGTKELPPAGNDTPNLVEFDGSGPMADGPEPVHPPVAEESAEASALSTAVVLNEGLPIEPKLEDYSQLTNRCVGYVPTCCAASSD